MAAPCDDGFDCWLSTKLQQIHPDVDLEVFVQYITGIMETDTSLEDKTESIVDIIGQIVEENIESHSDEITKKWVEIEEVGKQEQQEREEKEKEMLDEKLADIMGRTKLTTVKVKETTQAERERKAAILAQYAQVSDGEEEEEAESAESAGNASMLAKNVNSQMVNAREKAQRDHDKQESEAKKQKDKEEREKQKQKSTDRKENEKKRTQKGERKR